MRYIFVVLFFLTATLSEAMEVRPVAPTPSKQNIIQPDEKQAPKKLRFSQLWKEIKKELHPMLSRGLVMAIMGACLVVLGILFYPLFDTVILTIIFGVVCLIGLITLLLYFANPKMR